MFNRNPQVRARVVSSNEPPQEPTYTVELTLPKSLAEQLVCFSRSMIIGPDHGLRGVLNALGDVFIEAGVKNKHVPLEVRAGTTTELKDVERVWFG